MMGERRFRLSLVRFLGWLSVFVLHPRIRNQYNTGISRIGAFLAWRFTSRTATGEILIRQHFVFGHTCCSSLLLSYITSAPCSPSSSFVHEKCNGPSNSSYYSSPRLRDLAMLCMRSDVDQPGSLAKYAARRTRTGGDDMLREITSVHTDTRSQRITESCR